MITQRKSDHLSICQTGPVESGRTGLDRYRFVHCALPEIDHAGISTASEFVGKKISAPLVISAMTGGTEESSRINRNLAVAAEKLGLPLGVGSMRVALEHPETAATFELRRVAPTIPLLANLGLVQLNYGYGLEKCQQAVDLLRADALVFHLNPLQEVLSRDGNTNFKHLLPKLEKLIPRLSVPVIVKEVGNGLSAQVVRRLYHIGVKYVDLAGWGGTSWALIEGKRNLNPLASTFENWGIPTADAIVDAASIPGIRIIASGGVRSGIDIAKSLALGAHFAGIALPLLKPATESAEAVKTVLKHYIDELRIAMFCIGAKNIRELKSTKSLVRPDRSEHNT